MNRLRLAIDVLNKIIPFIFVDIVVVVLVLTKKPQFLYACVASFTFFVFILFGLRFCILLVSLRKILTLFVRVVYLRNTFDYLCCISIPMDLHSVRETKKGEKEKGFILD